MKFSFSGNISKNNSIEEIRDLLLHRTYLIFSFIGFPVLIFTAVFFNMFDIGIWGLLQITPMIPVIIIYLIYNKVNYNFKSNLIIDLIMFVGLFQFYLSGYTGAGIMLFLTVVNLSIVFLKPNAAYFRIALCVIFMAIIGTLYTTNTIKEQVEVSFVLHNGLSWSLAITTFALLSTIFTAVFTLLNKNLIYKIQNVNDSNDLLEDANKKLKALLNENKEINEKLNLALKKAEESNKLKTEFFHNMSHEVRTPLNGIVGFSKILKKKELNPKKQKEFIEIILNNSNRLQKVIDDIVEVSILNVKQQKVTPKEINIKEFLHELFKIFQLKMEGEVKLINQSSEIKEDIIITSDTHILTKILGNLLENAIKFTFKGYIEIGLIDAEKNITIYIKDTGIGIHPDKQVQVFERFSQADASISDLYGGLGLGLCIAKENTNILGGEITFESKPDVGTTFFIRIPKEINTNHQF